MRYVGRERVLNRIVILTGDSLGHVLAQGWQVDFTVETLLLPPSLLVVVLVSLARLHVRLSNLQTL